MKIRLLFLAAAMMIALSPALAVESETSPILGQLSAGWASVDGVEAPSGTTLFDGNTVEAALSTVAVHLTGGHVLEIARRSSAQFERIPQGIRMRVHSGTVSFRQASGEIATLSPEYVAVFTQRRAGQPIGSIQNGLTAIIAPAEGLQRAERGQKRVPVNDSSRVHPTSELLLQTSLTRTAPPPQDYIQEVSCGIESIRDNVITLVDDLTFTFEPGDLLIQGSKVPESRVYTRLSQRASSGDDLLNVEDSKAVNPLERIVLRNPDGRVREVACVRYTEEDLTSDADQTTMRSVVKIAAGLENAFEEEAEVIQGRRFTTERTVTTLARAANDGQRGLRVVDPSQIDPLQQILIRSPDGKLFEGYCVYYIRDNLVALAENLDHEYPAGSEIIQGRSSQELIASGVALQRTANCCCCCDGFPLAPVLLASQGVNPLWFILGGAAAAGGGAAAATGGGGGSAPPPPPPPSVSPVNP